MTDGNFVGGVSHIEITVDILLRKTKMTCALKELGIEDPMYLCDIFEYIYNGEGSLSSILHNELLYKTEENIRNIPYLPKEYTMYELFVTVPRVNTWLLYDTCKKYLQLLLQ